MKRIAIVDDNSLLRENLAERLQQDYEVIYQTDDANELMNFIAVTHRSAWPDLVLMDIEMDALDGITATAKMKDAFPDIRIAMLTVFEQEEKVWESILAGADGYILKDEPRDRLLMAISDIINGGAFMSATIAMKAMRLIKNQTNTIPKPDLTNLLTSREYEILELIANGFSYKEIAEKIFISVFTAKTHIHNIYEKLQVKNKTEAAMKLRNFH